MTEDSDDDADDGEGDVAVADDDASPVLTMVTKPLDFSSDAKGASQFRSTTEDILVTFGLAVAAGTATFVT